jgi:hypothetical protein
MHKDEITNDDEDDEDDVANIDAGADDGLVNVGIRANTLFMRTKQRNTQSCLGWEGSGFLNNRTQKRQPEAVWTISRRDKDCNNETKISEEQMNGMETKMDGQTVSSTKCKKL